MERIKYKLYVFQPPHTQIASSHKMEKLIRKGAPTYVVQCQEMEWLTSEVVKPVQPEIQGLIQKYKKVFKDLPMELPPKRKMEHVIEIKYGSSPVNIKTYRYPYHHKTKIEILIYDLLKCGVITES